MRTPMVTRTVKTTNAVCMMVNVEDKSVFEQTVTLPRTYKDTDKVLKLVKDLFKGEPVQPVSIISTHVEESLYGMTEADFLKYSTKLPPRETKN